MENPDKDPKNIVSDDNPNPLLTPKGIKKTLLKFYGNIAVMGIGAIFIGVFKFEKYNPDQTSTDLHMIGFLLVFWGFYLICSQIFNIAVTMWKHGD